MTEQSSNKRIAKNTMFLFFRMLVVMSINLYASRVVVATLGVNDFGVYSVVGNIVIMLGVLSVSMSTSTQRFLSYSMGKNDKDDLSATFNSTIAIHVLLAVIIFVFAEIIGVWYISNYLDVDSTRLGAAQFVFQFSLMTMLVKIVTWDTCGIYCYVVVGHWPFRARDGKTICSKPNFEN